MWPAGAGAPYNGQYEGGYASNWTSPGGKYSNGVSATKPHYISVDPKLNLDTPTHFPSNLSRPMAVSTYIHVVMVCVTQFVVQAPFRIQSLGAILPLPATP